VRFFSFYPIKSGHAKKNTKIGVTFSINSSHVFRYVKERECKAQSKEKTTNIVLQSDNNKKKTHIFWTQYYQIVYDCDVKATFCFIIQLVCR